MVYIISLIFALLVSPLAIAAPLASLDANTLLQNGQDAQALNAEFQTLTSTDACTSGQTACISGELAQCVADAWNTTSCSSSQSCFALPSVRDRGTIVSCTSEASALSLINATGATGGIASTNGGNTTVPFPTSDSASNSTSNSTTTTTTSDNSQCTTPSTDSTTSSSSSSASGAGYTVTLPPQTLTLSPAEASSIIASLADSGSFTAISTSPLSFSPQATTSSDTSSSSSTTSSAALTTIFLTPLAPAGFAATSPTSPATTSSSSTGGYGY